MTISTSTGPTGPDDQPGCSSPKWQGAPILSARLILRPLDEADAPAIARLAGEWEVACYTALIPHPYPEDEALGFIQRSRQKMADGSGRFVVLALEKHQAPGLIGCLGLVIEGTEADLGYWLGQPFWGQGLATEAVRRLARMAFQQLGLTAIQALVHPDNPASGRVLEKAGFTDTGLTARGPGRCGDVPAKVYRLDRADWQAAWTARPMLLVSAVALIDPDNRVLLASRPPGKMMSGLWEFPGGKVDKGETPEAALVRELQEELGIDVGESCLAPLAFASHDYDSFHLLMPLYVCRTWQGQVTAREGQSLVWVRPNRLSDYPMPPADIPLVALLRDWL